MIDASNFMEIFIKKIAAELVDSDSKFTEIALNIYKKFGITYNHNGEALEFVSLEETKELLKLVYISMFDSCDSWRFKLKVVIATFEMVYLLSHIRRNEKLFNVLMSNNE